MPGEHGLHNQGGPIWERAASLHLPVPYQSTQVGKRRRRMGWGNVCCKPEDLNVARWLYHQSDGETHQLVAGEDTAGNESCDQTTLYTYQYIIFFIIVWQCLHLLLTNAAPEIDVLVSGSPSSSF